MEPTSRPPLARFRSASMDERAPFFVLNCWNASRHTATAGFLLMVGSGTWASAALFASASAAFTSSLDSCALSMPRATTMPISA